MTVQPEGAVRRQGGRGFFDRLSYLQYPFLFVALGYSIRPYFTGFDTVLSDYNYVLLYGGIGVGLSSLQDARRTQNTLSLRIWQDPRKGARMIQGIALGCALFIAIGLAGTYLLPAGAWTQLSTGVLVFGIGLIGVLKTAIEMFEHHRLDRQPAATIGDAT